MAGSKVVATLDEAKFKTLRAFSSWEAFKETLRVKNTLSTESPYVDAHPAWINEGIIMICV